MPDPAPNPLDVSVDGQRPTTRPPSPFSNVQWPSKWLGPGDEPVTVEEGGSGASGGAQATDEMVHCSDPVKRKQWNADAKANEAIEAFRNAARQRFNEPDLQMREFGALVYEMPNGDITLSEVFHGDSLFNPDGTMRTTRPTVYIPPTACGAGVPLGSAHSHPGLADFTTVAPTTHLGSGQNFDHIAGLEAYHGRPADSMNLYIISDQTDGTNRGTFAMQYKGSQKTAALGGAAGEYVNPNATPCPGDN